MDEQTARARLTYALDKLARRVEKYEKREDYYRGDHALPYAPPGVNQEYLALREQAVANWVRMAVDAPLQRLRGEGVRLNVPGETDGTVDAELWRDAWEANHLGARQRITYVDLYSHGHAVVSVFKDKRAGSSGVIVRPEPWRSTYLHVDPLDAFDHDWAVKTFDENGIPERGDTGLPSGVSSSTATLHVATVYDRDGGDYVRFEKGGPDRLSGWTVTDKGKHGVEGLPFVPYTFLPNAYGEGTSAVDPLIPQADAINTIRFNTLLAMQYSAFRQRVFTGFDPVRRRADGSIVYKVDEHGNELLDPATGERIPEVSGPGRLGVDRALVFPGADTKVFDLAESNLANYVTVLGEFMADLFAIAQVPPQYLLNRTANLSGDALAGAESTLQSLVRDLQGAAEQGHTRVLQKAAGVLGHEVPAEATWEFLWGDGEARSFAQVVDAIVKLATTGFPRRAQWELIPGATLAKVDRWVELAAEEQAGALNALLAQADQTGEAPVPEATPSPTTDAAFTAALDAAPPPPDGAA